MSRTWSCPAAKSPPTEVLTTDLEAPAELAHTPGQPGAWVQHQKDTTSH